MSITNGATSLTTIVSQTVSGLGFANNFLKTPFVNTNVKLPMMNPLSDYVTYNYVISLGALRDEEASNPDSTYMRGRRIPLICKTAGADPSNRINTQYGKFDFFIDDVEIDSVIGFENNKNTNVGKLSFSVVEPYSMGLFMLAVQQATFDAGHGGWIGSPFLLTIEFQGNQQNGSMVTIPNTTRYIPFNLGKVTVTTSEKGTVYHVTGSALQNLALTEEHATIKSDTSVRGKTVQEVLQSGEQSLQAVVNQRLQQYKEDGVVEVPDEVVILFPIDTSTSNSGDENNKESSSTATTSTPSSAADIYKKLGVERNPSTKLLVQNTGQCNALGRASMGYGPKKKSDAPINKDNAVYDTKTHTWDQTKNTTDMQEGNLRFGQDLDIPTVINQVLISSNYSEYVMSNDTLDEDGMRTFWRIDTQVFPISTNANYPKTGTKPRVIVYRVLPYKAHSSKLTAPNTKAPGFDNIKSKVVKQYDYIYTGKNTEVLKFNIDLTPGFAQVMPADSFKRSHDLQRSVSLSAALGGIINSIFGGLLGSIIGDAISTAMNFSGNQPSKDPGVMPTRVSPTATQSSTDGQGGGGLTTSAAQATRYFTDAVTSELNMAILDLDILGDPYWINQSGFGNYTSKPTQYKDLNSDMTVNYQNGEVDILVNFRTPIDINQATGMYNFGSTANTAPVTQFSGLYHVTRVKSTFSKGMFKQNLTGNRRPQQENKKAGTLDQLFSVSSIVNSVVGGITSIFK